MRTGTWWSDGARDVAVISRDDARDRYFGGVGRGDRPRVQRGRRAIARCRRASSAWSATWPTPIAPRRRPRACGYRSIPRRAALPTSSAPPTLAASPARCAASWPRRPPAVPIEYLLTFDRCAGAGGVERLRRDRHAGRLRGAGPRCWPAPACSASSRTRSRNAPPSSARAWRSARAPATWSGLVARESLVLLAIGLAIGLAGGVGVGLDDEERAVWIVAGGSADAWRR